MARSRPEKKMSGPPRRILIAPDKFKGTLSSEAAAQAIRRGLLRAWPEAKITCLSLTDGGEGFVEMMVRETRGRLRKTKTVDAAWRPCVAQWGVLGNGRTAVIGLSNASGIAQLPAALRNPELTSNLGTGRLLAQALKDGFREIVVGGRRQRDDRGRHLARLGDRLPVSRRARQRHSVGRPRPGTARAHRGAAEAAQGPLCRGDRRRQPALRPEGCGAPVRPPKNARTRRWSRGWKRA